MVWPAIIGGPKRPVDPSPAADSRRAPAGSRPRASPKGRQVAAALFNDRYSDGGYSGPSQSAPCSALRRQRLRRPEVRRTAKFAVGFDRRTEGFRPVSILDAIHLRIAEMKEHVALRLRQIRECAWSFLLKKVSASSAKKPSIWLTLILPSDKFALPTISSKFLADTHATSASRAPILRKGALRLGLLLSLPRQPNFTEAPPF